MGVQVNHLSIKYPCSVIIGAKPQLQRKPKAAAGKEEVLQKLEVRVYS